MNLFSPAAISQLYRISVSKFFSFSHLNKKTFFGAPEQPWYKRIPFGLNTLRVLLFILIILVGLSYIVQVNLNATRGFVVTELNQKSETIDKMNQKLELQAASLRSLENIQKIEAANTMVKINEIEYLETDKPVVTLDE